MQDNSRQHLTLLQLQKTIKERLDEAFPLTYWVAAEISEMKVNYSGHCYLELVEKGGDNQVPRAKCSAVIWRSTYGALSSYFSSATGDTLKVGLKVLLRVSVTYHELYGLSLNISDIDPIYTLGEMEQQRLLTIKKLQEEGVYDMNRALELPSVIQRIAVVSSRNAAGYQDFMQEIARSSYRFDITLFDAFMQGAGAEDSIVDSLEQIAMRTDDFDVVVVIRGGGSQSDLACFNSYRLTSHLAQFPLPVVTGIGHDKDQSVADLVAAVTLKTPTAVAAWLVDGLTEVDSYIDALESNIMELAVGIIDVQKRFLQNSAFALSQVSSGLTRQMDVRLERLAGELARRGGNVLLQRMARLDVFDTIIEGRKPDRILSLGFAIVRRDGRAVKNADALSPGDNVEITLSQGSADAKIEKIYGKK